MEMRETVRCSSPLRGSTCTPRSTAYERSRFSPGFIASTRPSPANAPASRTLNDPPSSVEPLAFVSQRLRSGRPLTTLLFHSETRSAPTSWFRIGTSADWFLRMEIGSLSLYSNRSPTSPPSAAAPVWTTRVSISSRDGGGGGTGAADASGAPTPGRYDPPALPPPDPGPMPPATPPATPPTTPPSTPDRMSNGACTALASRPSDSSVIVPWCVCGITSSDFGSGTTGRWAYNGCDSCWRNDCGAPATSDSSTFCQSSPIVLSTIAHACSTGAPPRDGSTIR